MDEEKLKEDGEYDVKDINPVYYDIKQSQVYVDDTDKDNIITLPLIPVSNIKDAGIIYKFEFTIDDTDKLVFTSEEKKINVIGLFSIKTRNKNQITENVSFYTCQPEDFSVGVIKSFSCTLNVNKKKISGGKYNAKKI